MVGTFLAAATEFDWKCGQMAFYGQKMDCHG